LSLVLLLSTLLFFSFYNEGYYFLSLMIMYFFMLPRIFASITQNMRALETQLLLLNQVNNLDIVPLRLKSRLFKLLRASVVLYLIGILIVNAMRIVMVWYLEWINYVLNELVILLIIAVIGFLVLPNNSDLFVILDPMSIYNPDELFAHEGGEMTLHVNEQPPDMSNIIVVEFPWNSKQEDAIVPLSLGVGEREGN